MQALNTERKLYIKTYGCQMNVYDSEKMMDLLAPFGFKAVNAAEGADMVILNTCHIREKASEKVFSELGRLKQLKELQKEAGKNMILAVAGCVAQAEGKEIRRRAPYVDMVFGPQTYHELPKMITTLLRNAGQKVLNVEFPAESKFDHLPKKSVAPKIASFVSIQEGCDKFCSYCVVPYTRGSETSRPVQDVLDECRALADQGAREITLLGQNVNAYHGSSAKGSVLGLGSLIGEVADINGIERIQYTTSHPGDMEDDLFEAHRDVKECMPYLHLPIQSGSNKVLEIMNRKHTVETYCEAIDRLRKYVPDLALSSDFIAGHPGESEQDFAETLKLVNRINYAQAYSFKFSPRPGTPAATYGFQVDEKEKGIRLQALQQLLNAQQMAFNTKFVNKQVDVLVERYNAETDQLIGRSQYMQLVYFKGNQRLVGQIVPVKVDLAQQNSLLGSIVLSA